MKTWTMSKTGQIARRLLYQNRWIYLFLMLWPFGMAAILLVPAAKPETEDVLSILHQECLYGLGLVAFTGGALLGNEQRSRRIASVLSRAVSRRQYFFALVSAAWLPLRMVARSSTWSEPDSSVYTVVSVTLPQSRTVRITTRRGLRSSTSRC